MEPRFSSRRRVLTLGLGGVLVAGHAARGEVAGQPSAIARKFDPDGRPRRWPGNTILCFVGTEPPLRDALASLQETARAEPLMRGFALLPVPSLHMTLLAGLDEQHRRVPYWPASLAIDAPLAEANAWCRERLSGFATGGGRFRMRIAGTAARGPVRDLSVRLSPAGPEEAEHLRTLRARLCERLEIQPPHSDAYQFHITLGYLVRSLTDAEDAAIHRLQDAWLARLAEAVPAFSIGPPVLCRFESMEAFVPMLTLTD